MKVIVLSDTHGCEEILTTLVTQIESANPALILHLGDNYPDAEQFIEMGFPVIRVPGTWTPYYQNPMIDNRRFDDIGGWRFFLTHTPTKHFNDLPDDIDPEEVLKAQSCEVFCHGHLHVPEIREVGSVCVLNPGHLTRGDRRGPPPSYAVVDIQDTQLSIEIIEVDTQKVLLETTLNKSL